MSACEFENSLFSVFTHLNEAIEDEFSGFGGNNATERLLERKARQLALAMLGAGFFLRPAINKMTGGLFGSDDDWQRPLNQVFS